MAKISVYLKAIVHDDEVALELTDSHGNTGINDIATKANHHDHMEWKCVRDSNIKRIVNIYAKPDSKDLFSKDPRRIKDNHWKGTISSKVSGTEYYNIEYEYKDGRVILDDPRVVVIPPPPPND